MELKSRARQGGGQGGQGTGEWTSGLSLRGAAVMMNHLQQSWASKPALHSVSSSRERLGGPTLPLARLQQREKVSPVKMIWHHRWKSKGRVPGRHKRPDVPPPALPISEHAQLLPTTQCRLPRHLIRLVFPPAILEGFPFCQSSSGSWNSLPASLPHTAAFGPDLIETVPYPDGFSENKV